MDLFINWMQSAFVAVRTMILTIPRSNNTKIQWPLHLFVAVTVIVWLLVTKIRKPQQRLNLPPSPPSLPIIGHLHHLGDHPHRSLHRLALSINAPLMHLKLGRIPTLVASTAETAKEIIKTNDSAFCSRPDVSASRKLSYGYHDLALSPYGKEWTRLRSITTIEVFSRKSVESFEDVRDDEVGIMMDTVSEMALKGENVNLRDLSTGFFNDIVCRIVLGRRTTEFKGYGKSRVQELVRESMMMMGEFFVEDFFPSMRWLGQFMSSNKRLNKLFNELDEFFEKEMLENDSNLRPPNVLQTLMKLMSDSDSSLDFAFTREHVKALVLDLFLGGTDTSAVTVEWAITELIRKPDLLKKATDEVRTIVGQKERVSERDLKKLTYIKLVVKETLRLHPPIVLLIPRECREACKVGEYDIEVGTRVFVNAWAIMRDPKYWEEPEVFWPERFENNKMDYKGQDFEFLPFGSGRRICPGMTMGILDIELALANLLHGFDWEMPSGMSKDEIDMTDLFGISVRKKHPLIVKATIASNV